MITGQQAAAVSDLNPEVQWRHPRTGLRLSSAPCRSWGGASLREEQHQNPANRSRVISLRFESSHLFRVKRQKCMQELEEGSEEFLGPPTSLQWLTGCKELGV